MKNVLIFSLVLIPFVCRSQISSPNQKNQTIRLQNLKMKIYSGDSISYSIAKINVPENRIDRKTNMIQLSILILKSKAAAPFYPIVFLAGGPGQSGVNYIREEYFQKLIFQLQQYHDIILLDQRGSGSSLPSLIYKMPESDKKNMFLSKENIIQLADLSSKAGADTLKKEELILRDTIQFRMQMILMT